MKIITLLILLLGFTFWLFFTAEPDHSKDWVDKYRKEFMDDFWSIKNK